MSLKKDSNFPITAENKTGGAFKQVRSDLNRMTTTCSHIGPLASPRTGAPLQRKNRKIQSTRWEGLGRFGKVL